MKAIKKGSKGIIILAADVSPVDVISHIPVLCEDTRIPYVYVRSRMELGVAAETKKPTSVVLMLDPSSEKLKEKYEKLFNKIVSSHLLSFLVVLFLEKNLCFRISFAKSFKIVTILFRSYYLLVLFHIVCSLLCTLFLLRIFLLFVLLLLLQLFIKFGVFSLLQKILCFLDSFFLTYFLSSIVNKLIRKLCH